MTQQTFHFAETPPPPPGRPNLVIEAGAGTGKTTAIVGEVLRLLLSEAAILPERLVLITFTEKAAAEISERIRDALLEIHEHWRGGGTSWPIGSTSPLLTVPADEADAWRGALRSHMQSIDRLRSQTIHSFCQRLLRSHPLQAGIDPGFSVLHGDDERMFAADTFEAWLKEELRADPIPIDWQELYVRFESTERISGLLETLASQRDLVFDDTLSPGAMSDLLPRLMAAIEDIRSIDPDEMAGMPVEFQRIFAHLRRPTPPDDRLDSWIEWLAPIAQPLDRAPMNRGPQFVRDRFRFLLRSSKDKGKPVDLALRSHRHALHLIALARRYAHFVDERKRSRGYVTFDDLLRLTDVLLEDPVVLRRITRTFDHIFVDEFQDTDAIQARILRRLTQNEEGRFRPGILTIVGDPKQSIYSFRGADPETYARFVDDMLRDGAERRRLEEQFRSRPTLLSAINATFQSMFPQRSTTPHVFQPEYLPLTAGLAEPDAWKERTPFVSLQVAAPEEADAGAAEADAVASMIDEARREGADVASYTILLRQFTALPQFLEALEARGIPYVVSPGRNLHNQPIVVDLVSILRAICYPFDKGHVVTAARTLLIALTDEEITRHHLLHERPDDCPCASFERTILRWADDADDRTVGATIDLVLESTALREWLIERKRFEQWRFIEHFRDIASTFDEGEGTLRQFVALAERLRNEKDADQIPPEEGTPGAVRIMTVHSAKGLEFDIVILPQLAFASQRDRITVDVVRDTSHLVLTGDVRTLSADYVEAGQLQLGAIAKQRADAETLRLLYVAMTRARHQVVLVTGARQGKAQGFWNFLQPIFGTVTEGATTSESISELRMGSTTVRVELKFHQYEIPERERITAAAPPGDAPDPIVLPIDPLARLTPAERRIERHRSRQRIPGIAMHRALELWLGSGLELAAALRRASGELGLPADVVARLERRIATIEPSPTAQRLRAARLLGCEIPLFAIIDGATWEGRVDLLLDTGDALLVVDHKSGAADAERFARDAEQVRRYMSVVREMSGRPVGGLLWYIGEESDEAREVPPQPIQAAGS